MVRTRREVVGLLASGLLAGCTGVGVPSVPNPLSGGSTPEPGSAATPTPTATATPTSTPTTPTATATPEDPGAATRRVFDEVEWFATEYGPATESFRSLAARTRNLADSLSRRSSIDREAVTTLERLFGRVETAVYERLGPHFDTSPSVRSFNRDRLERVETLRARQDWDGVARVLAAVADRYATYASEAYVERTFPRDPVRGPLVRYATAEGHAGDLVLMAYHVGSDSVVRVQRDPSAHRGTPPGGRADVDRYRTLFGPLSAGAGGEAGAYVTATSLIDGRSLPLAVRRYRDDGAAASAVEGLLEDDVTAERTVRPEGREWRRVFYQSESEVMYAELTRTGRFLVAAGPGRRPWADRPTGWRSPMELTWLGG
ncbi:MAG: hypothetical protein ABEH47_05670 [Haloferacaceae archaeon]